ncbi:MAG: hypothetical protein ACLUTA_02430 [Blautia wexlerae]
MAEIIFGIDHGNGNMKGSNVDFPCGLVRYTSEPGRFMNEDILEYQGTFYTLSETRMPFKADKTVDEDYFILTLFALALEAKSRGITLSGKDIVLGIGLPPADFGQQAPGFKRYFMEHSKHFRTNPAVFLGGGSLLLKPQIEKSPDFKYIEFIEDVRANAIGYEKLTAMRLQKR